MEKGVPDFLDGNWMLEYCSDFYYDPAIEGYRVAKWREPDLAEAEKIKARLKNFWFAKAYVYRHKNQPIGGAHIRIFDREIKIKKWGPEYDREIWANAVLVDDKWQIARSEADCQFEYQVAEDGQSLEAVSVCLYGTIVGEYRR